jgi:hypothetical protein
MVRAESVVVPGRTLLVALGVVTFCLSGCSSSASHASVPSTSTPSTAGRPVTTTAGSSATTATIATTGGPPQRFEPAIPVALQEGAAAAAGGRLVVVGGYDTARNSSNDVFVFDGAQWRGGPSLPIRVNHPGAATIGQDVYVVGGFTPEGATSRAFVLAPGAGQWREIAPMRRARGALALVAFDGRLYAIGGRDGSVEVGVTESYDPRTQAWSDHTALPDPRNHLAGFVDGTAVCVAGGRTPSTSTRVDCVDPQTGVWSPRATLPIATSGAAAAELGDATMVAGGESAGETSLVAVVQMLRGGQWHDEPMLLPRHGTAFAIYRGRLWLCGGATSPGYAAVSTCTSVAPGA